jgi:F0F1-type ATP synthase assembly protein I
MDMVGTVIVFFLVGFVLDRWLDTSPWCTVILTVVGIVGTFLRTWYAYSAEMDRLDAERRAPRATVPAAHPAEPERPS